MADRDFAYWHASERLSLLRLFTVVFAVGGVYLLLTDEATLLLQPVPDWFRILTGLGALGVAGQGLRWHLASRRSAPAIEGTEAELVLRLYPGQELKVPWMEVAGIERTATGIRIRFRSHKPVSVSRSLIEGDIDALMSDLRARIPE